MVIGDKVKITDCGCHYPTHKDMFQKMKFTNRYENHFNSDDKDKVFIIFDIFYDRDNVLYGIKNGNVEYLFNMCGIVYYEPDDRLIEWRTNKIENYGRRI